MSVLRSYEHYDTQGTKWTIRFNGEGNTNDFTIRELARPFFTLTYEGDRLKRSRLEVHVLVRDENDLVNESDLETVTLSRDDTPYWTGSYYLTANEVQESGYPFIKTYSFRDPVINGALPLEDEGTYSSLVELVAKHTGESLEITTYPAWYHSGISTLDTDYDFFANTYIDEWNFREIQDETDSDVNDIPLTSEQILTEILELTDSYLIQTGHKWHLVQHDALASWDSGGVYSSENSFNVFRYAVLGGAIASNVAQDSAYEVDQENLYLKPTSSSFVDGAFVQTSYKYKHRSQRGINIRFIESGFVLQPGESETREGQHNSSNPGGDQFYFSFRINAESSEAYDFGVSGIIQITLSKEVGDTTLYWNGRRWVPVPIQVDLPLVYGGVIANEDGLTTSNFDDEVEFKTAPLGNDGPGTVRVQFEPLQVEGNDVPTRYSNIRFNVVGDALDPAAEGAENSEEVTHSLTISDNNVPVRGSRFDGVELIVGQGPNEISRGALRYKLGTNYPLIRSTSSVNRWERIKGNAPSPLGEWKGDIAGMHLRSKLDRISFSAKILRADLIGTYSPERVLSVLSEGKAYAFERGRLRGQDGEWNAYVREIRPSLTTDSEYIYVKNSIGFTPGLFAPKQYKSSGIYVQPTVQYEPIKIGKAAIDSDGDITGAAFGLSGGAAKTVNNTPIPDGSILYNTEPGDTLPYFYENLFKYENKNIFRTSTDDWTASSADVELSFSLQQRLGAIDDSGILLMKFDNDVETTQEFGIEKALVDQEYKGYFRCEVYVNPNNGATQGVKIVAGTQSDSTLSVGEWVTLELQNTDQAKVEILGTDMYGETTYNQTFEDVIHVRSVTFIGNIFDYSGGGIEMYDPQVFDWREDADILIARNVSSGDFVNFGFVTFVSPTGEPVLVANQDYGLDGTYEIVGRWLKTIRSISGDVITTGTINAGLVSITNLDDKVTIVIRSDTEPTERPDTTDLVGGDVWINTAENEGDRIYTWNPYPIEQWVEAMTAISGDSIVTGTIDASQVTITNFAGAGSVTIRSVSQPTQRPGGSALVEGDIWIDPDNGNKPHVFNGSSWSEVYTAISGNSIVTGEIDASVVTISNFTVDVDDVTGAGVVIRSDTEPTTRDGGAALQEGDIWIDTYNGDAPYSYDGSDFVAQFTQIDGNNIITGSIEVSKLNVTDLESVSTTTGALTVDGTLTVGAGGSIVGSNFELDNTGANIGNWVTSANVIKSLGGGGPYIELNSSEERIQIKDGSNNPLVAMGFLDGLSKNDGTGDWGSGSYGFWAKDGSQLQFDGDATYEAGEWNISELGAVKILDTSDNVVIRLGYYDPGAGTDYGLWFFDSTGGELGYVTGEGFQVGDAGNDKYISYTPATGLVVKGSISTGANSSVDGTYIEDGTITAAKIAAGTITANEIAADSINADLLDIQGLSAVATETGALTVTGDLTLDSTSEIKITNAISLKRVTSPSTGAGFLGATGIIYLDSQGIIINGVGTSGYGVKTSESGLVQVASASGVSLGFFDGSGATKQTVSGSRGGNAALASLLDALEAYGLITDSTT